MGNRSLLRLFAAVALLGALSGCASLSKNECLAANWEDIGVRDGANGQPEEYLIQHSTACAKVGVTPDRNAWLIGREHGLERFCTPQRAYQIGEYGGSFDTAICRDFDVPRLHTAYGIGRELHDLNANLASIDSEIRNVRTTLAQKDLDQKTRERLAYRLGQLDAQYASTQRALEDARYRARDL
jgi:hypothetical protein